METTRIERYANRTGSHAVVIGGSIAGLLAARVLTDHFDHVTLIERDRLPEGAAQRKGVPQSRHIHQLLGQGLTIIARRFPDLLPALINDGAVLMDLGADTRVYQAGQYRVRFHSDMLLPLMSRPLLEHHLRESVRSLPKLALWQETDVTGVFASPDRQRICGVIVRRHDDHSDDTSVPADLVVDASGRGSRAPRWLEALNYPRPQETVITVNFGYTSRIYRPTATGLNGAKLLLVLATQPQQTRTGMVATIEGGRWLVTLGGWLGDHPPADDAGFLAYARSLPAPDIYQAITSAEPLSDFAVHKFPSSLRRRYERLQQLPDGFLVLGDALCSFNPIYGQGMTAAALEVEALDACLREYPHGWRGKHGLPQRFFRRAAQVIEVPWQMATGVDLQYPQVVGRRPAGSNLLNWYNRMVQQTMMRDAVVARAFLEVVQLQRPPSCLFNPRIVARIACGQIKRHAHVRAASASQE